MKQGQGNSSGPSQMKREPIVHPVTPAAAGQIGVAQAYERAVAPMNEGRGASSPQPAGMQVHRSGSQGKHGD